MRWYKNDIESREEEDADAGYDLQLWDQMDMARALSMLERAGRPQQALVSALLEIESKAEQGVHNYASRLRCQEIRYIARDALNQSGLA